MNRLKIDDESYDLGRKEAFERVLQIVRSYKVDHPSPEDAESNERNDLLDSVADEIEGAL